MSTHPSDTAMTPAGDDHGHDTEAKRLLELVLHLRMYGECAPGGHETWAQLDRDLECHLRGLPRPEPLAHECRRGEQRVDDSELPGMWESADFTGGSTAPAPIRTASLPPFAAKDLSMDMGKDGTYPFTEGESAEITGYGHQDKAEFAAAINRYDKAMNGDSWDEEGWSASDISHQWAVRVSTELCSIYADRERTQLVGPDTPGAFPITTLWNAR
jgi:hypothetical protein